MKVYVVTSGSYSDYGIDYIFRDETLAKKFVKKMGPKNEYQIEEYETMRTMPKTYTYWYFEIAGKSKAYEITMEKRISTNESDDREMIWYSPSRYGAGNGVTNVSAKRAQKLAAEMYQRYIRDAGTPAGIYYEEINDDSPELICCTHSF